MTDLAQALAQKIRFTRIKPKGMVFEQGKGIANIKSQKWIGQVRSPVTGTVDEANPALRAKAALINNDPYGEGWVAIVKPKPEELDGLVHGTAIVEWYKKEIETRTRK
jgi:glycine cleavage system H protein